MTQTRDIVLGGKTFAVPVLPLRHNRVIYPLCRDLSADPDNAESFIGRLAASGGSPDKVADDELDKLIQIAFHAAQAADKELSGAAFDELPITPPELLNAFFLIRLQTGAWLMADSTQIEGGEPEAGEAKGA
jgi:hypothetical protein